MKTFNKSISLSRQSCGASITSITSSTASKSTRTPKNLFGLPSSFLISKRYFAEGEEIRYPKVFKNVFNKRVSRDGKRVFYTVYPYDYNEPWPFPPVYDRDTGADLNRDDVWGNGQAPPSSITGKPKRALGHYPWLGRPIVPLDEQTRWIMDDQIGPYPFFAAGRYEQNRTFYWQWILFTFLFFSSWYVVDHVWRGDGRWGNLARQRDELFYKEHMAPAWVTWGPIAQAKYANPCAPLVWRRQGDDKWCMGNSWLSYRFDHVFIPAAKEDMYADEDVNYFKMPGYNC